MFSALRGIVLERGPLWWLGGPVLDKELKVLARRRRTYAVRFGYVVFLMVLVLLAWLSRVVNPGRLAQLYSTARLPQLGRSLVITLVWFQFYAAQVIALVTFSGTISTEIRRRTLDVLLSTPINSVQIVLGKLVGGLLPVIFLIGVSLPFLAVIRVFGGIEWDYVVAAVCITLTATLFVAAVSMLVSVRIHQPYKVITLVLGPLLAVYVVSRSYGILAQVKTFVRITSLISAEGALFQQTYRNPLLAARMSAASVSWPMHCLFMLGLSVAAVTASMVLLRRGAYAAAAPPKKKRKRTFARKISSRGGAVTVTGSPVLWKDLGGPFRSLLKENVWLFLGLMLVPIVSYVLLSFRVSFDTSILCLNIYTAVLWIVASVRTAAMAATAVTREKEARTWSSLLGTTMDDWQIIHDKAAAVLLRNWPVWMVLAAHAVVFPLVVVCAEEAFLRSDVILSSIILMTLLLARVAAALALLVGGGLFFSVRLKSSTAAVVATLALQACLRWVHLYLPGVAYTVLQKSWPALCRYFWPLVQVLIFIASVGVGLWLLRAARLRLRRYVF